ncbi:MAG: hypothetical protein KF802_12770 [Bdellovibrionaceae bacterium]|nr:hypothetical protein [Pseudobdellovibrionaceae bacterium]MBX3034845.1 hypothetical protein [Pseudobdellovibrionaceae bacterium]
MLKDLDQMNALVKAHVQRSQSESDKVTPLRVALRIVLSRPDDDGMVDKVIGMLRSELEENDAWESTVTDLTNEALTALKQPESLTPVEQVTYAVFLENVVAQMKPRASDMAFEYANLKRIRDARIKITPAARSERNLRTMRAQVSPSDAAAAILQTVDARAQKAKSKAQTAE